MGYPWNCRAGLVVLGGAWLLIGCQQSSATKQGSAAGKSGGQNFGVVQNVRQAVKRTADIEDLRNFALAYYQYATLNDRGPSSVADIKDSLPAKMVEALQDESVYVVIWNVRNPSSATIVAYAAEPDSYGKRLVARGDGSVASVSQEEFEKVKPKH